MALGMFPPVRWQVRFVGKSRDCGPDATPRARDDCGSLLFHVFLLLLVGCFLKLSAAERVQVHLVRSVGESQGPCTRRKFRQHVIL